MANKAVILYASKQGTSRSCAEYLNRQYDNTIIYDVSRDRIPQIAYDDQIIIITGIYLGKINRHMRRFIKNHELMLSTRDIEIVVCAGTESKFDDQLQRDFSDVEGVVLHTHYGGFKYNFSKLNVIERFFMKRLAGATDLDDHIRYDILDRIVMNQRDH